jgi:hypothetical protein
MVAIQPVTLWIDGTSKNANVFILIIVIDDLSSRAVFYYRLGSETPNGNLSTNLEILQDGNLTIDGEAYEQWDSNPSANQYAYNWAAEQLNLIIL